MVIRWNLQLGHNLLIVDRIDKGGKIPKVQHLQLGHNLLIVDSSRKPQGFVETKHPSIGPQSFDCGQSGYDNSYTGDYINF